MFTLIDMDYLTLLCLVIALIFVYYKFLRPAKKCTILLTGISNSGKSQFFQRFVFGNAHVKTVTSLDEISHIIGGHNVVDIPGNAHLRTKHLEKHRQDATKVVFFVNLKDFSKESEQVAEYLFQILSDKYVNKNKAGVILALNAMDSMENGDAEPVVENIRKRINVIRDTKKGQLGKTSNTIDDTCSLGVDGKEFHFNHLCYPFECVTCDFSNMAKCLRPKLLKDAQ